MAGVGAPRYARILDRLWGVLRNPLFAVVVGMMLLLLIGAALWLPQAPGQTRDDPAAAQRWVNAESERWGAAGTLLRVSGLFTVFSSSLFLVLISLELLLTLVHLAEAIQRTLLPRRLRRLVTAEPNAAVHSIAAPDPVERTRVAWPVPPTESEVGLADLLGANVGPILCRADGAGEQPEDAPKGARLLAGSQLRSWWLRLCLPLGTLLLLVTLLARALWGWNVQTPTLAPGDTFEWEPRALSVAYAPGEGGDAAPGLISASMADESLTLPAGTGAGSLGAARVDVAETAPALWVSTDEALLQQPGQIDTRSSLGMSFEQPGSEQVVVLPGYGAGLRIIRTGQITSGYLVEIFAVQAEQPVQRKEIRATESITLPIAGEEVTLRLEPSTSLAVRVSRTPLQWLMIPAGLLILAGTAGYVFKPRYALATIEPWPEQRSAITLSTNSLLLVRETDSRAAGEVAESPATPSEPA